MALQLWKIEEANQETGKRELLCSFGYNTKQNLPLRNSLDMDHWGYYNGPNSSNGSLFPAHTVLGHAIPGADRTPHWPCTSANMLTSVTYKGGGKKEFEYEPEPVDFGRDHRRCPYQRDSGICLRDGSRFRHPVRISRRRSIRYGYLLYVGRYGKSLFGQYVHISYQQHEFQCAVRSERIADRLSAGQRDSSGRLLHALPVLVFRSVFGFLTGDIHALRCRHDARTSELFVTHLPSPNLLCMATGAVAGTKPVFGRRGPCRSPTTTGAKRRAPRFSEPVVCPRVTG